MVDNEWWQAVNRLYAPCILTNHHHQQQQQHLMRVWRQQNHDVCEGVGDKMGGFQGTLGDDNHGIHACMNARRDDGHFVPEPSFG